MCCHLVVVSLKVFLKIEVASTQIFRGMDVRAFLDALPWMTPLPSVEADVTSAHHCTVLFEGLAGFTLPDNDALIDFNSGSRDVATSHPLRLFTGYLNGVHTLLAELPKANFFAINHEAIMKLVPPIAGHEPPFAVLVFPTTKLRFWNEGEWGEVSMRINSAITQMFAWVHRNSHLTASPAKRNVVDDATCIAGTTVAPIPVSAVEFAKRTHADWMRFLDAVHASDEDLRVFRLVCNVCAYKERSVRLMPRMHVNRQKHLCRSHARLLSQHRQI
ncbi:hypothetical protein DFJ77DRAFT_136551 [Powellomyces hirtus]|nr:hypothetical protein DFJ77DRAFT_136551 [Powellomyces hirtus]